MLLALEKKTRTRIVNRYEAHTGFESLGSPALNIDTKVVGSLVSTQTTESIGHPIGRLGHTNADVGGEFFSSICTHSHNCPYIEVWSGGVGNSSFYRGPIFPFLNRSSATLESLFSCSRSTDSTLNALGTTAISRVVPTNPVAGLAVTLGELREGFPKMIGHSLRQLGPPRKNAAGEYLNWEFGWKPLIADFKKWLHAYRNSDKLWSQFLRDSGRRVRRRYTYPKSIEITSSTSATAFPAVDGLLSLDFWQGTGSSRHLFTRFSEVTQTRRRWFSGAFTYFVDLETDQKSMWKNDLKRLKHLYGVEVTPEVIWNLTPWSWAVDWLTNTGDIITNVTRFSEDGLCMPYGYMMETTIMDYLYRMRNVTPKGYNIADLTQIFTHTVKYRRGATPFGFGLSEAAFTPRQWAIIAALGLSRSK
jgi:hypothetical protein